MGGGSFEHPPGPAIYLRGYEGLVPLVRPVRGGGELASGTKERLYSAGGAELTTQLGGEAASKSLVFSLNTLQVTV